MKREKRAGAFSRQPGKVFARESILACALLLFSLPVFSYVEAESDYRRAVDPALGISVDFGRWDSAINLVYDPDGAPAIFSDDDEVLALLEEATGEWALVSGIQFNVIGSDSGVPDDDQAQPNSRDGLVRVHWTNTGGAAGIAGPASNFYDQARGYFPYIDGSVELSDDPQTWESTDLVQVLVHELGHLLGLGHSDNPDSIMFAHPYNHLRHPRADDIRAAQTIYGTGTLDMEEVTQPIAQWVYQPPPAAPASATQFLFKPNSSFDQGSFIAIDAGQPLSAITASTQNDEFVFFFYVAGPASEADIDMDASIVFQDPFGYLFEKRKNRIECARNFSCVFGTSIGVTNAIKTIPGEWTVYMIDDASGTTLHEFSFTVNTTVEFNQAPVATSIEVEGISIFANEVTLEVSDPDSDTVNVTWHTQGSPGSKITETVASGSTITRVVNFAAAGEQTLFIELNDGEARYTADIPDSSSAGNGFQSLIALTLDLPVSSDSDVSIRANFDLDDQGNAPGFDPGGDLPVTEVTILETIAASSVLELVRSSDGSTTTAQFGAGASSDSGATTSSAFASGEDIIIAGSVTPQIGDVGFPGEIFIVLVTGNTPSYLDLDGNYAKWKGSLNTIGPAFVRENLKLAENFEVFSGTIQSGLYRVFMGYRLTEGGPLHFNSKALRINVE